MGFRTADPAADLAVLYGLHPHLPVYPERRLAQRYLDLHLDVSPAARRAKAVGPKKEPPKPRSPKNASKMSWKPPKGSPPG